MTPPRRNQNISETLILNVQAHPALWDPKNKDYKDNVAKLKSWNEIFVNMRASFSPEELLDHKMSTLEEVKARWKGLRTTFVRRNKKEQECKSSSGNFIL